MSTIKAMVFVIKLEFYSKQKFEILYIYTGSTIILYIYTGSTISVVIHGEINISQLRPSITFC